jgi:hypothetical protein
MLQTVIITLRTVIKEQSAMKVSISTGKTGDVKINA